MNLDIPTVVKIATAGITILGIAKGGYEAYREYELHILNEKIMQCQIAELRDHHKKGTPIGWQCMKIALQYAGVVKDDAQ